MFEILCRGAGLRPPGMTQDQILKTMAYVRSLTK